MPAVDPRTAVCGALRSRGCPRSRLAMGPPWLAAGAGQDVGRSCILVSIAGKNVMLDCGMHMGYNDDVSTVGRSTRFSCL